MAVLIDREKCLACGTCQERCILDNIRVETPPCRAACPIGINPQAYAALLSLDRAEEALSTIYDTTPFPRILAYVCQAPCERSCTRKQADQPVAIRYLKRYLVDKAAHPVGRYKSGRPSGKKTAVVGAGPAGMAASVRLREMGHEVCMFDSGQEAGGMALSCIPRFHLPKEAVRGDAAVLETMGVERRFGVTVGKDVSFSELREQFDAVLLAVGTHFSHRLNLEGEDASGVMTACPS